MNDAEIGKKIKQYRKGKMTQQELANLIGRTESSIRKYEKGLVTIPLDVLGKIASILDVTVFQLMGNEYFDVNYPDMANQSKEYEGFLDYLQSLGYAVNQINAGDTYSLELTKEDITTTLEQAEFEQLQGETKDSIAFKLWQKQQKPPTG